eukprot:1886606-Pleurochrysis_carterae.AAC.4
MASLVHVVTGRRSREENGARSSQHVFWISMALTISRAQAVAAFLVKMTSTLCGSGSREQSSWRVHAVCVALQRISSLCATANATQHGGSATWATRFCRASARE